MENSDHHGLLDIIKNMASTRLVLCVLDFCNFNIDWMAMHIIVQVQVKEGLSLHQALWKALKHRDFKTEMCNVYTLDPK